MKTNREYKDAALGRIRGNWSPVVLATVIYLIIIIVFCSFGATENWPKGLFYSFTGLFSVIIYAPLYVGYLNATKVLFETGDLNVSSNMWKFGTENYLHKVFGILIMSLKLILWTCLLVVPGLIMFFGYFLTPYILEEHPEISAWDASTRSREMMRGHKTDLFMLMLSFIGWYLLSILTLGIGLFWLIPYFDTTMAAFYEDLKGGEGNPTIVEG